MQLVTTMSLGSQQASNATCKKENPSSSVKLSMCATRLPNLTDWRCYCNSRTTVCEVLPSHRSTRRFDPALHGRQEPVIHIEKSVVLEDGSFEHASSPRRKTPDKDEKQNCIGWLTEASVLGSHMLSPSYRRGMDSWLASSVSRILPCCYESRVELHRERRQEKSNRKTRKDYPEKNPWVVDSSSIPPLSGFVEKAPRTKQCCYVLWIILILFGIATRRLCELYAVDTPP